MNWLRVHFLLLCFLGVASACVAPRVNLEGSFNDRLRAMLDLPRSRFGGTRADVIAAIGKPDSERQRPIDNDAICYDLSWEAISGIVLHAPNMGNQSWLMNFRLGRKFASMRLPIEVGDSIARVTSVLGTPRTQTEEQLEYVYIDHNEDTDRLIFHIAGEKVREIEWSYSMD